MQPESLQQQCHMCSTLMNSLHRKFAVEKAFKSFFRLLIRHSDDCKCADDGAGKGWYESPGSFSGAGSCSSALSGVLQCSPGFFWDKKPVEASSAVEFFFVAVFSHPGGSVGGFRSVLSMFCKVPGWFRSDVESWSRGRLSAF